MENLHAHTNVRDSMHICCFVHKNSVRLDIRLLLWQMKSHPSIMQMHGCTMTKKGHAASLLKAGEQVAFTCCSYMFVTQQLMRDIALSLCTVETDLWCRLLPMSLVTKACKYTRLFCIAAITVICESHAYTSYRSCGRLRCSLHGDMVVTVEDA